LLKIRLFLKSHFYLGEILHFLYEQLRLDLFCHICRVRLKLQGWRCCILYFDNRLFLLSPEFASDRIFSFFRHIGVCLYLYLRFYPSKYKPDIFCRIKFFIQFCLDHIAFQKQGMCVKVDHTSENQREKQSKTSKKDPSLSSAPFSPYCLPSSLSFT